MARWRAWWQFASSARLCKHALACALAPNELWTPSRDGVARSSHGGRTCGWRCRMRLSLGDFGRPWYGAPPPPRLRKEIRRLHPSVPRLMRANVAFNEYVVAVAKVCANCVHTVGSTLCYLARSTSPISADIMPTFAEITTTPFEVGQQVVRSWRMCATSAHKLCKPARIVISLYTPVPNQFTTTWSLGRRPRQRGKTPSMSNDTVPPHLALGKRS